MTTLPKLAGIAVLLCAGLSPAFAQGSPITLTLVGDRGNLRLLVGESLRGDGQTGVLSLFGGVEMYHDRGDFMLAERVDIRPIEGTSTHAQDLAQIDSLALRGTVLVQTERAQLHADAINLTHEIQRFEALGSPVTARIDGEAFTAQAGMRGDLERQIFYGFGQATFTTDNDRLQAEHIQITLPPEDAPEARALIAAKGNILIQSEERQLRADQAISSADGRQLYLSGNVTITVAQAQIAAGSVSYNLDSQDFELDSTAPQATPTPLFLQPYLQP